MIAACIFLPLLFGVLWSGYWALARPIVMHRSDFVFDRQIAKVEWAIIEGLPESQARDAAELLEHLKSVRQAPALSFSLLAHTAWHDRAQFLELQAQERARRAALPAWMGETWHQSRLLVGQIALANSPLWLPVAAAVLLLAYFSERAAAWWEAVQYAAFSHAGAGAGAGVR